MSSDISFGTDGWRAVMCEEFTFPNVRKVTQGICNYLKAQKLASQKPTSKNIVIGYDTRFFSDKFAIVSAEVFAANGFTACLTKEDAPTPATVYSIKTQKALGAIMFTASHNPFWYNGLKFIPEDQAPALPDVTYKIEQEIKKVTLQEIKTFNSESAFEKSLIKYFDPKPDYIKAVKNLIDLAWIKKANLRITYDPLYSTGRNYLPKILGDVCDLNVIHQNSDPYFGGLTPEPKIENLAELIKITKAGSHLGLATDGDADRFGVIDYDGAYFSPNQIISILLVHLIKNKKMSGPVARTVATTHLIDRICKLYNLDLIETPVGFKYIGQALKEGAVLGGEESGGLSIKGHIPEKDGILADSLVAEIRAIEGKNLTRILSDIMKKAGFCVNQRIDIHYSASKKNFLLDKLKMEKPAEIAGLKTKNINKLDGLKIILEDDSWVLFRASGTEPVVRIYVESDSKEKLNKLSKEAVRWLSLDRTK